MGPKEPSDSNARAPNRSDAYINTPNILRVIGAEETAPVLEEIFLTCQVLSMKHQLLSATHPALSIKGWGGGSPGLTPTPSVQ